MVSSPSSTTMTTRLSSTNSTGNPTADLRYSSSSTTSTSSNPRPILNRLFNSTRLTHFWIRTVHFFSFHLPFPNHPNPDLKFFFLILNSFAVNALAVAVLLVVDHNHWADRTSWDYLGAQRPQRMTGAGCEFAADDRTNFLAQKITSLSNFTFSFAGLVVLQLGYYDFVNVFLSKKGSRNNVPSQLLATHPLLSIILGGCLCMMCITSFVWHASLAYKGALLDFGTMYILIFYLFTLSVIRLLSYIKWKSKTALSCAVHTVSFLGLTYGCILFNIEAKALSLYTGIRQIDGDHSIELYTVGNAYGIDSNTLVLIMILAVFVMGPVPFFFGIIRMSKNLVLKWWKKDSDDGVGVGDNTQLGEHVDDDDKVEWEESTPNNPPRRRRSWGLGFLSLFCILLAKWFRDMDTGFLCLETWGPRSFFQAHALWHTFCALSVFFIYLFLRSEVFNIYAFNFKDQEVQEEIIRRESVASNRQSSVGGVTDIVNVEGVAIEMI